MPPESNLIVIYNKRNGDSVESFVYFNNMDDALQIWPEIDEALGTKHGLSSTGSAGYFLDLAGKPLTTEQIELIKNIATKHSFETIVFSEDVTHHQEHEADDLRGNIDNKIKYQLLPFLRDKRGYDPLIIEKLQKETGDGFCVALAYLFLYATDDATKRQDVDDLDYLKESLALLKNTNFSALSAKNELSAEDNALIDRLDRFLQILSFYQLGIWILDDLAYEDSLEIQRLNPQATKLVSQFTPMFLHGEDTRGKGIDIPKSIKQITETGQTLSIDDIAASAFNSFMVIINECHAIAVKRDPNNADNFLVYNPDGKCIDLLNNPHQCTKDNLAPYLTLLANYYPSDASGIYVTGFNFKSKPESKIQHT